ncbi:protein kinase domain-containing protein [Clostridium drakei]|uniref:Protein kinase domain-containing protein n=1 Tax=Clostridium drakei TaxID=332101 RepID=A0A2U8DRB3_9CLOT|nr:protein kinase [Clostridium drakei]AWI05021.1 hypothetical protein B9W14_11100 [Clostridium drakei]
MKNNNNITQINGTVLSGEQTQLNLIIDDNKTSINQELNNTINNNLEPGTVLCDKYEVISKLDVVTGEADLYICKWNNKEYIAKVYRREFAIKQDVVEILKSINSPFVSKIYETGIHKGKPFEVLDYYKNGSLQGRKLNKDFNYEEIRKNIIPSINEGLKVLHSNGIIHKDLKPSNIMITDNGKDVTIIDFGISSVKSDGNTIIVTKTGMTPEYSAPETFRNLFLEESDYYSFGITIFELFCGYTPYKNMKAEEIEKYVSVQRIPFQEDMPSELKNFISALTYYDITNRRNKKNPNRRWTYDEVKQWCDGKKLAIPGEGIGNSEKLEMPPYTFLRKKYTDIPSLVAALAENWENGKKQLFRGLISGFFKGFNPEIATFCLDAELEATRTSGKDDIIFWKLLYTIYPELRAFYWKGGSFESINALGRDMLERLWKNDTSKLNYYDSILSEKLLSTYVQTIAPNDEKLKSAVGNIEAMHEFNNNDERSKLMTCYQMAYMLSGQRILDLDGVKFKNVGELASYMKELLNKSYEEFESFCHKLIDSEDNLDIRLESWLIAIGKRKELDKWKETLVG